MNMNYLNTVACGRLTKDVKVFNNDPEKEPLACFTVAVGTGHERTTFIDVELRGDRVAKLVPYLVKGKEVIVDGLPFARGYEGQNGIGASLCLFANTVQLGNDPRPAEAAAPAPAPAPAASRAPASKNAPARGRAPAKAASGFDQDDDIPY
jgi:single-stranded DNA-binding protein